MPPAKRAKQQSTTTRQATRSLREFHSLGKDILRSAARCWRNVQFGMGGVSGSDPKDRTRLGGLPEPVVKAHKHVLGAVKNLEQAIAYELLPADE